MPLFQHPQQFNSRWSFLLTIWTNEIICRLYLWFRWLFATIATFSTINCNAFLHRWRFTFAQYDDGKQTHQIIPIYLLVQLNLNIFQFNGSPVLLAHRSTSLLLCGHKWMMTDLLSLLLLWPLEITQTPQHSARNLYLCNCSLYLSNNQQISINCCYRTFTSLVAAAAG